MIFQRTIIYMLCSPYSIYFKMVIHTSCSCPLPPISTDLGFVRFIVAFVTSTPKVCRIMALLADSGGSGPLFEGFQCHLQAVLRGLAPATDTLPSCSAVLIQTELNVSDNLCLK